MATSFDPASTATALANAYVQAAQTQLTTQTQRSQAQATGLTKLQTALKAFDTAVAGLSNKKTMVASSATFSSTGFATATTTAKATPGTYPLFIEQVATASQVVFTDLPAVPVPVTGTLSISQGGIAAFDVDFSTADIDGNGTLSQAEMARAINSAADNKGKVTASVLTTGNTTQLVLTSATTGEAGEITVNASTISNAALKANLGAGTTLVQGKDAILWLGAKDTGVKVKQASNTYTGIEGVSVTLTQAQASGASPVNLTVANDTSGTAANVKTFVDAFNTLKTALDALTTAGSVKDGTAAGVFSSDSSIRSLRNKLNDIVRQDFGGVKLTDFGVSSDRDGKLTLDNTKLEKKLAASPDALDTVFGTATLTTSSGLLGATDKYLDVWLNSLNGQIKRRQDSVQSSQAAQTTRQTRLDAQYESAYNRYLKQFTVLQSIQAQMEQTTNMFDAMSTGS